ncbi:MAG: response regulator [Dysgonamonadaceae bacterium]|jgi:signal transduction histidine kinase/ligand-binding sensor domain-containing protein/DNA-binding response OmpR family regulator|nr:response regulator [Dysgonamonadaceae bacterium]
MRWGSVILFLLCFINSYALFFKHLGTPEGLSQISVMSIYQDELGRMWFGTMEGISIYDGATIKTRKSFESTNQDFYIGNDNRAISGDTLGNIYFISDFSIIRYNNRNQEFTKICESNVNALALFKNELWAAINDTIYIWDSNKCIFNFRACLNNKNQRITKLFVDSQNRLWVGTNNGLYFEDEHGKFHTYIPSEDIYEIFEDSRLNMWISTRYRNFYRKLPGGQNTPYITFNSKKDGFECEHVRCFVEDDYGDIWIGSFYGLVKYNYSTDKFTVVRKDELPGSLQHSSVFSLYKDRQGSIWVGTYYGGVHHFNPKYDIFSLYSENADRNDCLSFSFVGRMVEDKEGKIWICTEGGGLNCLDRKTGKIKHFTADGSPFSISHNNLKSIRYSEKLNRLYIGTHTGGLSIFDIASGKFTNFRFGSGTNEADVLGNVVNQVEIYRDKALIMVTQKGFFKFDLETAQITPIFGMNSDIRATTFTIDNEGFLWSATGNSITRISIENPIDRKNYVRETNGLGNNDITKIIQDRKGRIFVGTEGSGLFLFDREKEFFSEVVDANESLKNIYCYDIAESKSGYLIILNKDGILFYNPDLQIVNNIFLKTALPITGINLGCGLLVCRDGEIFAGGTDGMTSFFENEFFSFIPADYKLYFAELQVNNEIVKPLDETGILKYSLPFTSEIKLKYDQNNLVFTFASNNYTTSLNQPEYEYMLEGFDRRWITIANNTISYTNLNPGSYNLIIREKGTNTYNPQTISMKIAISSPFWATPLFFCIYVLLAAAIIWWFYRFKRSQLLLQTSLEIERKEKEQNEQLNNAKLQFFMNISHEFRTPLTLIISQIETLLQSNSLSPKIYNKLLKIYRNTNYFNGLISELLDFRKLELGHIRLKVQKLDIINFVKEIYLSFYEYAHNLGISYRFTAPEPPLDCFFDPKQMQKVFYNLISNAFKYSPKGSSVEVLIEDVTDNYLTIKIIDSGVGIAKEEIDRIFDRFYQGSNNSEAFVKTSGSGIGLSLVKGIVELHHGTVNVESVSGYGSIFAVNLPKTAEKFSPDELLEIETEIFEASVPSHKIPMQLIDNQLVISENLKYCIMIVEDNEDLLDLLVNIFSETYRIITARNGKEGLEKARKERPDIIVSDIMMPEMSGTEMCLKIKNDIEICHIPVVLLTALSSIEKNIEGLQRGADDYISKPFNSNILLARCNNLVKNRLLLQKKFGEQKEVDTEYLTNNSIDRKFIETVNKVVEQHIGNSNFDMMDLARELAISRSSLYSKFRALTGQTPNDFLLSIRLKRASAMLKANPELQIADIADQLGFSSARYFSRCFKASYNISPVEFRRK